MAEEFTNWSKSLSFTAERRARPKSEERLVDLVNDAREDGATVRPVGSGHSSVPLMATDDILVSFERMAGVVTADAASKTATLLPGTTLEQAGIALAEEGLGLENLGDVHYQTIAGAISTGTHGTGITMGNLSSNLIGGRLVTGSGEVVPFGTEAGDDNDDLLRAARVSLGALGMFSSMTLRLLPAFHLHRRNWMAPVEWTLENFRELIDSSRHFDFYWYPRRDETQVRFLNEPDEDFGVEPPGKRLKTEEVGPSHVIIPNDRDLRFDEMEYMFDIDRGLEAFAAVRERVKERHRDTVGWRVLVRTIAADDAMISNCTGRATMTIALLQNNELDYHEYFDDMEPLLQSFGGRPHWGKKHSMTASDLAQVYPEWESFQSIRRSLDPDGVLLNDYLRELLEEDNR